MVALMEGRFGDAEQLIADTFTIGQRSERWSAAVSHRLALFALRRAQGRLAEIEELIRRSVHEFPSLPRFPSALAHLYGELGRERDARADARHRARARPRSRAPGRGVALHHGLLSGAVCIARGP